MLNLIIIDDDSKVADSLEEKLSAKLNDINCEMCNEFDKARQKVSTFRPDIVVLDLLLQPNGENQERQVPGLDINTFIWNEHFCPIVVYSAAPEEYEGEYRSHPFVEVIKKGRVGEDKVVEAVEKFRPHIEALKKVSDEVNKAYQISMREVAPHTFGASDERQQRIDLLSRIGRRRIAALMDGHLTEEKLLPLEMYLCPPVSEDVQFGEVIREVDADPSDPSKFCVVLTPSCDLVSSGGRTPKVSEALVAQCSSVTSGLGRTILEKVRKERSVRDRLLAPGHLGGIVSFPKYPNLIPTMFADLKRLKLVSLDQIAIGKDVAEGQKFMRIAGIDSPFREQIAWTYMQVACRPGLPEQDFDIWAEEIIEAKKEER